MKIQFKGSICFLILFMLIGCSSTITSQLEEPTKDPSVSSELSPSEDNTGSVQPAVTNEVTKEPDESSSNQSLLIETAVTDLAQHLNISDDEIEVISFESKTWSDTSMGCPHPEMAYLQVPQDGSLIQLSVDGKIYEHHSGGTREPFLCENTEKTAGVKPTPLNLEDFITPSENIDN